MAKTLAYQLVLENAQYLRGMKEAATEVKDLGRASESAAVSGLAGNLESTAAKATTFKTAVKQAVVTVEELAAANKGSGLGALSGELQLAAGSASKFSGVLNNVKGGGGGGLNVGKGSLAALGVIGAAATVVGKQFSIINSAIDSIDVAKLKSVSPALADQVTEARNLADAVANPIEGLLRWATGDDVRSAFAAMNAQLELTAAAQEATMNRIIQQGQVKAAEMESMAARMQAANRLLDAAAAADAVARDRSDAAAIAGGADPAAVQKARGAYDGAAEIAKINRDLEEFSANLQAVSENAKNARLAVEDVSRDPKATPGDLAKAKDFSLEKEKEFKDYSVKVRDAAAEAAQARRSVRERVAAAVDAAGRQEAQEIKAAERKAFEATNTPEAVLRKELADKQAEKSAGAAAIAKHKAEILVIEKQLATLQETAKNKAEAEATAAERQAAAEERTLAAKKEAEAKAVAAFAQEQAILAARANGDEKQVKQLERQAAVEATKQRLMEAGMNPEAAARAAERQQLLKETIQDRENNPRRSRAPRSVEESEARRTAMREAGEAAREARRRGLDGANAAAGDMLAQKPDRKDFGETISKKLDGVKEIVKKLDGIGVAGG